MKAVILAAGIGKRLKPLTDKTPKCLIEVNGRTLVERHLENLGAAGINEVCIVVGYKKDMIISRLGKSFKGMKISYAENNSYENTGSGYSLMLGLKQTKGEVIFMDADLAYEKEALKPVLSTAGTDSLLAGEEEAVDHEGVKVLADGNIVKEIGKKPKLKLSCVGESVGVVRLSDKSRKMLLAKMGSLKDPDFEWEHVLNDCLNELNLTCLTTGKAKWVEIDFPGDLETAEKILQER